MLNSAENEIQGEDQSTSDSFVLSSDFTHYYIQDSGSMIYFIHFVMAMFFHPKITFSLAISASHWTVDLDTGGQRYGSRVVSVPLW